MNKLDELRLKNRKGEGDLKEVGSMTRLSLIGYTISCLCHAEWSVNDLQIFREEVSQFMSYEDVYNVCKQFLN